MSCPAIVQAPAQRQQVAQQGPATRRDGPAARVAEPDEDAARQRQQDAEGDAAGERLAQEERRQQPHPQRRGA